MNIIIDEKIHNELQKNIVHTIEFGSGLKGESNKDSDKDLLHIVHSADWWVSLPVANQHLLQYKTETEDHIYCNAHTFIKSILDGDTTIFIEMHRYGALKGTILAFLEDYNLTYYRTLRAYLGIGRRDLKDIKKLWKNKDFRKMDKKFKFTVQSIDLVIEEIKEQCADVLELETTFADHFCYHNITLKTETMDYSELATHEKNFNNVIGKLREFINVEVQSGRMKKTVTNDQFLDIMHNLNNIEIHSNIMSNVKDEITELFFNSYVTGF